MCPFCMYPKDKITHIANRNKHREKLMVQVRCLRCFARGPIVSIPYPSSAEEIHSAEEKAVFLWKYPGIVNHSLKSRKVI